MTVEQQVAGIECDYQKYPIKAGQLYFETLQVCLTQSKFIGVSSIVPNASPGNDIVESNWKPRPEDGVVLVVADGHEPLPMLPSTMS